MKILITIFFNVFTLALFSQQAPSIKFGKVTTADFQNTSYAIDTSADAIVIADIGNTQIKGKGEWFSLEFKRHKRIHILKKGGYEQATVEIRLYSDGDQEEKLDDLKAVTFNYESGKIVETKLDIKSAVFKEKLDKNWVIKKFTFPNIRAGSIIEFEYKITSDFLFNLQSWYFQSSIPHLWSEYTVGIPQFLNYQLISQGYHPIFLNERKDKTGRYSVEFKQKDSKGSVLKRENIDITCGLSDFRWAMKDVPALKEEPYISSLINYIAKLEFQLAGYLAPLEVEKILPSWEDFTDKLLRRDDFGKQLDNTELWLLDRMNAILQNVSTESEKARKIYVYLRDNFSCTDHTQLYTENGLKKIFEKKSGGVAEINLLLTAMLRVAGIKADPVILSRKQFGLVYTTYPIVGRFNYVIARATIDGKELFLDASKPRLGFARLDDDCYNGQLRVVNETATAINLIPEMLLEKETVNVNIAVDNGGQWNGNISHLFGHFQSKDLREKLAKGGEDNYIKEIKKSYDADVKVENFIIDSLMNFEEPLKEKYSIKYSGDAADILYINPVLVGRQKQNPFKSANRFYPVEMPYKMNEEYSIVITVPPGYLVDEIPKPVTVKMRKNENVLFTYLSSLSEGNIKIKYSLIVNKTVFQPAEYDALRDFFGAVVAKQNEQVVLKKKTN